MENKQLIGQYIKRIRNKLGMKQKELAESLNISFGYLSEIESGKKSPGLEVIGNLQQKYYVNPSYLFTGEGDYFLTKSKEKTVVEEEKPAAKEKIGDIYEDSIAELKWYLDHITFVGFANKDLIDLEIKRAKEKNPKTEIPERAWKK